LGKARLLLITSMGGLLLLIALTAAAALAAFARVHAAEDAMRTRFLQSTARLQQIRDAIYLSARLARDYFVDPRGAGGRFPSGRGDAPQSGRAGAGPLRAEALAYLRLLDS